MKHIELKFIPTIQRYTTKEIGQSYFIQAINLFTVDHPNYKMEHKNMYISYDRLIELQKTAMENGYLFVY